MQVKLQCPDLKLHGFGLSKEQLSIPAIIGLLFSADSQAGGLASNSLSKSCKYQNYNNPALAYAKNIDCEAIQTDLFNM